LFFVNFVLFTLLLLVPLKMNAELKSPRRYYYRSEASLSSATPD